MGRERRSGRILVVDDEERWRELLLDTLSSDGFEVDTAASKPEALALLSARLYHLAVLDIRMELQDSYNEQGMELLRELEYLQYGEVIRVIILSAFGSEEQMREAFRDYRAADFVDKKKNFLDTVFLERVRDSFRTMEINLDLEISWQRGSSALKAVEGLTIEGSRIRAARDAAVAERCALELEDLFCRLFHNARQLLLHPLGAAGLSGTGVLWAQPVYDHGGGRAVVVKFGAAGLIEKEYRNFVKYVQPYVGGGRSTHAQTRRRTPRLGGIVYSLLGEEGEQLEDFATFYRRSDTAAVLQAIDHLFGNTCKAWYASPGHVHILDLTRRYTEGLGIKPEALERAWREGLKTVQGKDQLHFSGLTGRRTVRNPFPFLAGQSIEVSSYEIITHGDFNDQNILVDAGGRCWLIDFQGTGPGHILRDIAQLDAAVRIRLLPPEEATLDERLALEEALNAPDSFRLAATLASQPFAGNQALSKVYATCAHLRGLAARLVAGNPTADIAEYYAASLFSSLNMIRFLALPHLTREHALLSAGLFAERLGL